MRRLFACLALCALSACLPLQEPAILPTLPPEVTRIPLEPAITYHGALLDADGRAVGVLALMVGAEKARALACSTEDGLWQAISGWLARSVREGNLWRLSSAGGAALSAQAAADGYSGTFTARSGERYTFQVSPLVDALSIQQGAQEGVYWRDLEHFPQVEGGARLSLLVQSASPLPDESVLCGFVAQGENVLSRVRLLGVWLGGFSVFRLLDQTDQPLLELVGVLGHVDSIAPSRAEN
ncbi:MAG: hypothetical protein DYG88_04955 [Chloroflexi bacterium CFX4]|nr:hypothetical protein [Chloroflexi bacterium CFX4]MDL1924074.1 hypothetical protein [Chloroflexi bacterium CFX3]